MQRREKDKQEQDRLVLHLEREIEIQRSRLADGVSICEAEQLKRQKLDVDIREVELTIQGASQQGQAKLLKWRESIAELNKKDKQLQASVQQLPQSFFEFKTDLLIGISVSSNLRRRNGRKTGHVVDRPWGTVIL